jgi:aryl-alcohol dehydrogenase-like predicted oxidoreductase
LVIFIEKTFQWRQSMDYCFLGNTGVQVSPLCMGTMTFGKGADKDAARAIFNRCRDEGINFFDCANVYAMGEAERMLGEFTVDCRKELVLTSKVGSPMGSGINAKGCSRRHIMASVEASLSRLRTDHIDIYFIHRFDEKTPLDQTLRTLEDLVHQGKIRYTGASNFAAWQVEKALGISRENGWTQFSCIQPMYNLVKRQAEVEILPMAMAENLGVIAYNPLGGGLLSGKYEREPHPEGSRFAHWQMYADRYSDKWMHEAAVKFVQFAREQSFDPVSLAVAWVMAHPSVTAPILGARTVEQLEGSLSALRIDMSEELYRAISALTPSPPPATDRTEDRTGKS